MSERANVLGPFATERILGLMNLLLADQAGG